MVLIGNRDEWSESIARTAQYNYSQPTTCYLLSTANYKPIYFVSSNVFAIKLAVSMSEVLPDSSSVIVAIVMT